jgi:hypothetical protein
VSARRKAKAPPAPTAADVLAAAGRAHAAAVAALRAVQLPDAADTLEAAGLHPEANAVATAAAIAALVRLNRALCLAFTDVDVALIAQRRAIPDDMHRDDARAVIDAERAEVFARYLPLARAVDAARGCVSAAGGALRCLCDAQRCDVAARGYWLACGLDEARIALDCARGVEVRS